MSVYEANGVDPDQTAPTGAVWSGSVLFVEVALHDKSRRSALNVNEYNGQDFHKMHVLLLKLNNLNPITLPGKMK